MIDNHRYFHWYYVLRGQHLLFNVGTGAFLWLFLALTQPFGISNNNVGFWELLLYLLPVGLAWVGSSYLLDLLMWLLSAQRYAGDHVYHAWGMLVRLLLVVHLVCVFRGLACDWQCMDLPEYLELWAAIFVLFGLAYLPYTYYARFRFYHSMLGSKSSDGASGLLSLRGEGRERLSFDPALLVYLQADGNYVDCFLSSDAGLQKQSLRASLKTVEEQLRGHPGFLRVHRSYLVHIPYVQEWKRSEKLLLLRAGADEVAVPVSRSYLQSTDYLFTLHKS